ncbi:hypothetical protein BH23VER1_BH23VER1_24340 [soil metagenome]
MPEPGPPRPPGPCELIPDDYFRRLDKGEIFGDPARPLEVDVGCGDGGFLVALAQAFPERDFLGIERLLGRVRKVGRRAEQAGLQNLKVLRLESSYAVGWLLPPSSVARLHLLCPDPWPKKKHHSRRLVQPEFVGAVHRCLEPEGEFLLKSDYLDYFTEAVETVMGSGHFSQLDWPADAFPYPETDFERQWRAEGKAIHRARFLRAPAPQE